MLPPRLRFGTFLAPFHPVNENPTLAIERDLELVQHMDRLGYDEAWIGEHHSAGYEIIASPELFIAVAAERTRRIKLGTGVVSLPYHHPFMVAERINQLDHMTRGRVIFGAGPGQLPSDAFLLGIEVSKQRERMDEALGVITRLLRGEKVTHKSDWFELNEGRLQMTPWSRPHVEMAVAASISPSGPRAAGKYGLSMLSVAATTDQGFEALANHWRICEEKAAEHGQTVSRENWRLVGPMHVAETREQAERDMEHGLLDFLHYFKEILPIPISGDLTTAQAIAMLRERGIGVVGTPDDAAAQIERLQKQSGGFGAFLFLGQNAAPWPATLKSYELFARHVMPRFQNLNDSRIQSLAWAKTNSARFIGALMGAIGQEVQKHVAEAQSRAAQRSEK
jgi:limonene 1,2-monooxygenase